MSVSSIQTVMDLYPSPMIHVQLDGTLLHLNAPAQNLLESQGFSSEEYHRLLPPGFAEINQNCKEAEIGMPVTTMEFDKRSIIWTPFFGAGMESVIYSGVDITRMQRNEQDLILAKEKAEEGERLKAAFLDNMSHEIRTPLNSLLGFMNVLGDELVDNLSEDQKFYFELIQTNGFRLERTMREILDMSNFSSGSYEASFKDVDLIALINTILDENLARIQEKGLSLERAVPKAIWIIRSDQYCLVQMITHLLDNAIKYTETGTIGVSLSKGQDDQIELQVDDTGPGMNEIQQRHIFIPFTQGSVGHSKHFQGVGLGLALVRAYCDAISARIDLLSGEGAGSHYQILIPDLQKS